MRIVIMLLLTSFSLIAQKEKNTKFKLDLGVNCVNYNFYLPVGISGDLKPLYSITENDYCGLKLEYFTIADGGFQNHYWPVSIVYKRKMKRYEKLGFAINLGMPIFSFEDTKHVGEDHIFDSAITSRSEYMKNMILCGFDFNYYFAKKFQLIVGCNFYCLSTTDNDLSLKSLFSFHGKIGIAYEISKNKE